MLNRERSVRRYSLLKVLIIVAISLIVIVIGSSSIAVPEYDNTQKYMRETAAVAGILTIQKMQEQYRSQYGRYAPSLSDLGPSQDGAAGPASAGLIDKDLVHGEKQGYRFTLAATADGYVIHADPITFGVSGNKSFYSDQTAIMRENYGPEPATANSKARN